MPDKNFPDQPAAPAPAPRRRYDDRVEVDDDTPADLRQVADQVARQARAFLTTTTEVGANANPDAAISLLLLAVSDVLSAGARLGAIVDVVPAERFEPDVGPDADLDPLRAALENILDGIDDYTEIDDPVLAGEVVTSSVSGDLVLIAGALAQGLRHYDEGQVIEALWWWQYSYLSNWGERGAAVLRVLLAVLAHLRLDVDDDVAAEAEFQALHP